MKMIAGIFLVAAAIAGASVTTAGTASAQVNCRATNNPALRAHCQRQMIQIYQQQSQYYTRLDRNLGRVQAGLQAGQLVAPHVSRYVAGPQGGMVWDNSARAGRIIGNSMMRNPRIQRWNGRLYGLQ